MNIGKWKFGGQQQQQQQPLQKLIDSPVQLIDHLDVKKIGLTNFGNTCYANSVLQALYFCGPFRDLILQTSDHSVPPESHPTPVDPPSHLATPPPLTPVRRKPDRKLSYSAAEPAHNSNSTSSGGSNPLTTATTTGAPPPPPPIPQNPPTLVSALRSLFIHIYRQPADRGKVAPQAFINKLRELNELFRTTQQQDAHEFLNYLLNQVAEELEQEKQHSQNGIALGDDLANSITTLHSRSQNSNSGMAPEEATLVHSLFEGVLTSETRCLTCETVSSRDESFLDLSIDIEQNSSVSACLRQFSASEMLCHTNKFFCDSCCDLQEAEKRMKIKRVPNVLALHLKRFKYQEDLQKYIKLAYRVAFPFELRLFNTTDDADDADRLYELFGINIHIGSGPHHGHYISIIKTNGNWFVFDDESVEPIKEVDIPKYFGDSPSAAYVLYYQAVDIDLVKLGLRPAPLVVSAEAAVEQSSTLSAQASGRSETLVPILPPGLVAGVADTQDAAAAHIFVHEPEEMQPVAAQLPSGPRRESSSLRIDTSSPIAADVTPSYTESPLAASPAVGKPGATKTGLFGRSPSLSSKSASSQKVSGDTGSGMTPLSSIAPPTPSIPDMLKSPKMKDAGEKEKKSSSPWFKKRKSVKDKQRSETLPPDLALSSAHDVPPLPPPALPPSSAHSPSAYAYRPDPSSVPDLHAAPDNSDMASVSQHHESFASSVSDVAIPLVVPANTTNGTESPGLISHTSSSTSSSYPHAPPPLPPIPPPTISTASVPPSPVISSERSPRKAASSAQISPTKTPTTPTSPSHKKSISRFLPHSHHYHDNHESNGGATITKKSKSSKRPSTMGSLQVNHAPEGEHGSSAASGSSRKIKALPPLPQPPSSAAPSSSSSSRTHPYRNGRPRSAYAAGSAADMDMVLDISAAADRDPQAHLQSFVSTNTDRSSSPGGGDFLDPASSTSSSRHRQWMGRAAPQQQRTLPPDARYGEVVVDGDDGDGSAGGSGHGAWRWGANGDAAGAGPPVSLTTVKAKGARRKLSFTAPMLGFGRRDKHREKDKERERDRGRLPVSS